MSAVETMLEDAYSLRKALFHSGCSRKMYYHERAPRMIQPDPVILEKVKEIALLRPTFGTRRMVAQFKREPTPINRKRVTRIFHMLNWIEPKKKRSDIIHSSVELVKATMPYYLWETDLTYVWCGVKGWNYPFNAEDFLQREWFGYSFESNAVKENAITSVNNALAEHPIVVVSKLIPLVRQRISASEQGIQRVDESSRIQEIRVHLLQYPVKMATSIPFIRLSKKNICSARISETIRKPISRKLTHSKITTGT